MHHCTAAYRFCREVDSFRTAPFTQQLYVWESQIEVLARHLLLLKVAQDWELPIRQRANAFLEIFGNCSVQVTAVLLPSYTAWLMKKMPRIILSI